MTTHMPLAGLAASSHRPDATPAAAAPVLLVDEKSSVARAAAHKLSSDKERKLRRYQVWSVSDGIDVRPDLEGPLVYYSDVEQLERELAESVEDSKAILLENAKLNEALSAKLFIEDEKKK